MYCTRIFKPNDPNLTELLRTLSMNNVKYELLRVKKAHMTMIPEDRKYSAIVSWEETI
jgi:hypothetical protein